MLGGGTFTDQNKALPGAYVNFISAASLRSSLSDRGVAAFPLLLSWGAEGEVKKISKSAFEEDSLAVLGYPAKSPHLLPFRELFRNAVEVWFYRLNRGTVKASNSFGEARYGGVRGNDIRIVIQKNVDNEALFDVKTYVDSSLHDLQTVSTAAELQDNSFVVFKKDVELTETAGMEMSGGTDGDAVTGEVYQDFLDQIQSCRFHVLGCDSTDAATKKLFSAFTKRMRDEMGIKFQTVLYRETDADYEGVISVENSCKELESGLIYWMSGAAAGCRVNQSNTNKCYDGELTVNTSYRQDQLKSGIKSGKLLFHRVGDDVRVLSDINTLVTYTEDKKRDFAENQTVRVLDQIGNDIAALFNEKYLGRVLNNAAGRIGLWNEIVTYCKKLSTMGAIEEVESEAIRVSQGGTKKAVVVECPVQPVNCMEQLYMTVVVQ